MSVQNLLRRVNLKPCVARLLMLLFFASAAQAQDKLTVPPPTLPVMQQQIEFAADQLQYDQRLDIVTATGSVEVTRNNYHAKAATITWNRKTGQVIATDGATVTDPHGNIAYGDKITLTDTLKDGVVENMLIVLAQGGRLAAVHGEQKDGIDTLSHATYTPCTINYKNNCPQRPAFLIKSKRVTYDQSTQRVRFHNARIEVFGLVLPPIPYFALATGGQPTSGLLAPELEFTATNGISIGLPIYFHLNNQRDLTLTPYLFSASPPALQANYRALTKNGAFSVTAFGTDSSFTPIDVLNGKSKEAFRGYIDGIGRFQLSPEWDVHASLRLASDRTLLSNYEISQDDRLRSTATLERIGTSSYFAISGWGVETLRPLDSQEATPIALPEIDYRKRFALGPLGGKLDLQLNSLAISRSDGQDTQRAFTSAEYNIRALTALGQEIILTGYARGDVYHSTGNDLAMTPSYRGETGWQTRGIGALAAEIRWPLIGAALGGTQRFTPRLQIVASPPTPNLDIPNEDARAIELDDSNLFALNRFPGYDRWEDGTRITYGADWALDRPGLSISANIGQSTRLRSANNLFPDGTGLSGHVSDITGRTTIKYHDFISVTHRYRLDKDNFSVRRNEIDTTLGSKKTYIVLSYLKLNRHINFNIEDLQDHEEVRAGGRVQINKNWSAYGSTIIDLTTKKLDPQSLTNGFSPVRDRFGVAYETDCLTLDLSWRRDYSTAIGAQSGNVFQFRIAFRNIGR